MNEDKKNSNWWLPAVSIFSEVSTWIAVPIILALFGGKWLDNRYGTEPLWLLLLAGVGFLITAYGIVKSVRKYVAKTRINDSIEQSKNNIK